MRIAIIGAGPGGLCAAIQLRRAGFDDLVILEKAAGIGGTWWHNTYPGAECDVKSHLYSFSFEPKADWSRPFAGQAEIRAYLEELVTKYGLERDLRLNTEVRRARWSDTAHTWHLESAGGETWEADVVVSALGMFNEPTWPDIPGVSEFAGTRFHSARWDHDHDLSGKRVAVIGSAASAVQFIPEIAPVVGQLHVYQRSANWVLPKDDAPFDAEQLERFRTDPEAVREHRREIFEWTESGLLFDDEVLCAKAERAVLRNLSVVSDPEVREALTPTDAYGCKRVLWSNTYFPTFNRPNVELVTTPIERVTAKGVVTTDGRVREVDTLIAATGFGTTQYLSALDVTGRDGLHIEDAWDDGAQAYLGITTAGFPNLFMLYGPNTNNGSILFMLECQVDYVVRHLERMQAEGLAWLDVRRDVMDAYNDELQRDLESIGVWHTGCNGYYRAPSGRIVTQWPHGMRTYRERTQRSDADAYEAGP